MGLTEFLLRWIGTSFGILAAATLIYVIDRRLRRTWRHLRARRRHRRLMARQGGVVEEPQTAPPAKPVSAAAESDC